MNVTSEYMSITATQARIEVAENWEREISRIKKEANDFINDNIIPAIQTSIDAGKLFCPIQIYDVEDTVTNRIFEVLCENGFDVTITSTPIGAKPFVGTDFIVSWEEDHANGNGRISRPKPAAMSVGNDTNIRAVMEQRAISSARAVQQQMAQKSGSTKDDSSADPFNAAVEEGFKIMEEGLKD